MVAIPDSHNYRRHEIAARDLEREFGHERVQGAHIEREDQERPQRTPDHAEMQAERSGLSPQQAKEQVTRLWHQADSGTAFAAALRNEGWVLAKGDKRDFVLVDSFGETHSLARRIEGAKAAEVRERMAELDAAKLPSVAEARELQRGTLADRANENRKEKVHAAVPIILKLPMPIEHDSAKPLQVATARPKPIVVPDAAAQTAVPARPTEPKPPLKQKPEPPPSRLKEISNAVAAVTQRALAKTKSLFGRTKPSKAPKPPQPVHAFAQLVQSPLAGKPLVKQSQTKSTSPVSSPPAVAKKKLTREELDAMIGRQRDRHREHNGPAR